MRHRVNKIKFKKGYDANRALERKLLVNFIKYGKLKTTDKKAKVLKGMVDKLVYKAIKKSQADKNILLKKINNQETIKHLIEVVGPLYKNRIGGYVRITKIGFRKGDNSLMSQLTWTENIPAMIEIKKINKQDEKSSTKPQDKQRVSEKTDKKQTGDKKLINKK